MSLYEIIVMQSRQCALCLSFIYSSNERLFYGTFQKRVSSLHHLLAVLREEKCTRF